MRGMRKFLLLLILAQPVQAAELKWDWNAVDYTLQGIFVATLVMDRAQTVDISQKNQELNPILGSSPSIRKINVYFLSVAVLHTAVMAAIPRPFRNPIQGFSIAIEGSQVYHNWSVGYTMKL